MELRKSLIALSTESSALTVFPVWLTTPCTSCRNAKLKGAVFHPTPSSKSVFSAVRAPGVSLRKLSSFSGKRVGRGFSGRSIPAGVEEDMDRVEVEDFESVALRQHLDLPRFSPYVVATSSSQKYGTLITPFHRCQGRSSIPA